jgi:general nucleoside transport system permease protein
MRLLRNGSREWPLTGLAVFLALLVTAFILLAVGASPLAAYKNMLSGAFGSLSKWGDVFMAWVPLVLCAVALTFTFTAGLWNIGIEGQMILGAVAAAWAARNLDLPSPILIPLIILAGMAGGAFWSSLAGLLRVFGHVHEIFAGLGLNFLAIGLTNYLIFTLWKEPGTASLSGTEFFRPAALLPHFPGLTIGPVEMLLAGGALLGTLFALKGTMFGLRLKAVGKNPSAALLLGVSAGKNLLLAFILTGALAGAAGAVQAVGLYHRLVPSISGGYGYLAILVVLLSGSRPLWILPAAFFFAAANKGSLQLPMEMHLDSSLGGILQELLVLLVILIRGIQARLRHKGN